MNKRYIIIIGIALFTSALTNAQVSDLSSFGSWTGVSANKKINKRWSLDAELELRTQNALKNVDRWSVSVGADYKWNKYLKTGLSYTYLYQYNVSDWNAKYDDGDLEGYNVTHAYWQPRHRLSFDVVGEHKWGALTLSLRERLQYTYSAGKTVARDKMRFYGTTDSLFVKESDTKSVERKDQLYLRSRFQAEYNIPHCRLTPYTSFEWYNDLKSSLSVVKHRFSLGAEYKLNKNNAIDAAYRYTNVRDDEDVDGHVVSLTWQMKF